MNKAQLLQKELAELDDLELQLIMSKSLKDPWMMLTGFPLGNRWTAGKSNGLVITIDEHDSENTFKRFPNKEYLWVVTKEWLENQRVIIPKSRQILITWLMVALHLHLYMTKKGQNIFFQNKKESDANDTLSRAKFIYNNLPEKMKEICTNKSMAYCKMEAKDDGLNAYSKIRAIPQGADILRLHTASAILSDETAFQEKAEESYTASKPTIDGGGKFTSVSSANGENFFYRLKEGDLN